MPNPTVLFFSMPFTQFPQSGVSGAVYYATDTQQLYLCCGGSGAYFPLAGLLPAGFTLQADTNASSICGYPITNPNVEPADGVLLQFDATSKTWQQAPMPATGVTEAQAEEIAETAASQAQTNAEQYAQQQSIAMAIALG